MDSLTETEFDRLSRKCLFAIEDILDANDNIETDLVDKVLTATGARYALVVNAHTPSREMWLAYGPTAVRYGWDGRQWKDAAGEDILRAVSRLLGF